MKKLTLFTLLLLACSVNAVELIADERRVQIFSTDENTLNRPDMPFADFDTYGQTTTVSTTAFGGNGNGDGYSDFDFYVRESFFDITFAADSGTVMDLAGTYEGSSGSFGLAVIRVRLFAGTEIDAENAVLSERFDSDGMQFFSGDFSFTESLAAGNYRLVIQTDVTPGGFDTYGEFDFTADFIVDGDADGVEDAADNCQTVSNEDQIDFDNDGFGNACDADLDNNCIVNAADLGLMRLVFFEQAPTADLNSDGIVNVADLGIMRTLFFEAPGPSGLTQDCASAD
ncbi:MAG: hypothetical protein AB8G17_21095 [Gammaproteobacteria bacterium]